ncbi:hypothetical protein [Dactylosporangium matsuzakiense]|uniref:Uncharacterized protein n=1 Tax=Dactylosporangium matsuzakiense TaxID=53360 RepID=A0A9W6KS18_9ACTN|nr:hypothetical protein [Dactylosporangium matsuzakiense]UWZ44594.1 hypothetical protein Dmats_45875 [Dactylosporangium matsuzakiense]GLL05360.1 hypothetical protein GCM10017581_071070 [Dactylosporangium matsuzakiense]
MTNRGLLGWRLAGTVAMQLAAVWAVALVVALAGAWHGADRSPAQWAALAAPGMLFATATAFAVQAHRTNAAGVARVAGRRALGLAILGAGLFAVAIAVWQTR